MVKLRATRRHSGAGARIHDPECGRTGDVIGQKRADAPPMIWQHVDLVSRVWTILRTKTGGELRVPLSRQAIAVLRRCRRSAAAMSYFRACAPAAAEQFRDARGARSHGFWPLHRARIPKLFPRLGGRVYVVSERIGEMALAHTLRTRSRPPIGAATCFEKRRQLMQAWADFCDRPSMTAAVCRCATRRNASPLKRPDG